MNDYSFVKINDCLDIITEKVNAEILDSSSYISTENLLPNLGGISPSSNIPKQKVNAFKKGDILFSNIRTYFKKVWFSDREGGASNDVIIFRSKDADKFDPAFLYFLISSNDFIKYTVQTSKGTKMPRGDKLAIREFSFNCHDIVNQRKIAKVLLNFNDKIALNKKMNATLEAMAQALFKSWFVDFDPVKAKLAAVRCGRDPEKAAMAAIACKLVVPPGKPKNENLEEKLPSAEAIDAAIASLDALSEEQMQSLKEKAAHFPSDFQESELGLIPIGFKVLSVKELVSRIKVKQKFTQKNVLARGKVVVFEQGLNLILGYHNGNADIDSSASDPKFIFGDHTCISHLSTSPFSVGPNVIPLSAALFNPYWTYYAVKDIQKFQEYRRHWMEFIVKKVVVPQNDLCEIYSDLITNFKVLINKNSNEISSCAQIRDTLLPKLLSGEISVASD